MLKGSLIEDLANIFFGFCLTFLVYDMEHILKTIPDHYEIYFFLHKQKQHEYIFYEVLNGRDGRFSLRNSVSI